MTKKEKRNINDAINQILKSISKNDANYNAVLTIGINAGLIPVFDEHLRKVCYFEGGGF